MELLAAKEYAIKQSKAHNTVTYHVYADKKNGEVSVGAKWPDPKSHEVLHHYINGAEVPQNAAVSVAIVNEAVKEMGMKVVNVQHGRMVGPPVKGVLKVKTAFEIAKEKMAASIKAAKNKKK